MRRLRQWLASFTQDAIHYGTTTSLGGERTPITPGKEQEYEEAIARLISPDSKVGKSRYTT